MTDFSRDPGEVLRKNLADGFVGVYFQQGVPILDRDLNLLQDMVASSVRSIVARYLGSGVPRGSDAFLVRPADRDHDVVVLAGSGMPGVCMVDGVEATITADRAWSEQPGVDPGSWLPPSSGSRTDTVYLDVSLATVEDADGRENPDIGVTTTLRIKPVWTVRVAQGGAPPAPLRGHGHFALAQVTRTAGVDRIPGPDVRDVRRRLLSLPDVDDLVIRPRITELSKSTASQTNDLVVSGTNFQLPGLAVTIAGRSVDQLKLASPIQITCKVPADAPLGDTKLVVSTDYGSAERSMKIVSLG